MFPRILLGIAIFGVGLGLLSIPGKNAGENTESQDAEVRKLLLQKRDLLQERVEYFTQAQIAGTVSVDHLPNAQMELLAVELELATSKADRLAILESQLQNRREVELRMTELHENANVTKDSLVTYQTQRIDAEIALLREKTRE